MQHIQLFNRLLILTFMFGITLFAAGRPAMVDAQTGNPDAYGSDTNAPDNSLFVTPAGNVGIGTANPLNGLHVSQPHHLNVVFDRTDTQDHLTAVVGSGGSGVRFSDSNFFFIGSESYANRNDNGIENEILRIMSNGQVGIRTSDPEATLDVNGTVRANVIQIAGGDLAEPFVIGGSEEVQPGMVVAIDPDHPGQLRLTTSAYDRTVAGVVSGAGGIDTGVLMYEEAEGEGAHPMALSGRVYVYAEASNGPITPGDLLTTASTPGHAMKVTDYDRAQGAILGKAMSKLEEGTGLVLVLVTLQ